jgi:hypothetical protein
VISQGDLSSPATREILDRTTNAWLRYIREFGKNVTEGPDEDVVTEMHKISLLRSAFEFAGGRVDIKQHQISSKASASDNMRDLGNILGIRAKHSISSSPLDEETVRETLLRSENGWINKEIWRNQKIMNQARIIRFVPVGVFEPNLPAGVVDNISSESIKSFQAQRYGINPSLDDVILTWCRSLFYRDLPKLRSEVKNDMYLFISFCAQSRDTHPTFLPWTTSADGEKFLQSTTAAILEDLSKEQTALKVATVVSLERLAPVRPDEVCQPVRGTFLRDYIDGVTESRRKSWTLMGQSINRVIDCHPAAKSILYQATEPEHGYQANELSDKYWNYVLNEELDPLDAFHEIERITNETTQLQSNGSSELTTDEWVEGD